MNRSFLLTILAVLACVGLPEADGRAAQARDHELATGLTDDPVHTVLAEALNGHLCPVLKVDPVSESKATVRARVPEHGSAASIGKEIELVVSAPNGLGHITSIDVDMDDCMPAVELELDSSEATVIEPESSLSSQTN